MERDCNSITVSLGVVIPNKQSIKTPLETQIKKQQFPHVGHSMRRGDSLEKSVMLIRAGESTRNRVDECIAE